MNATTSLITSAQASRAIVNDSRPKIVLAGSGMVTGGRVLHYLNRYVSEERNTVLLVGFQAEGTRGRALEEGAGEIKFFGQYHKVKAEVKKMTSLSAHADQSELLTWLKHFKEAPRQVFINHGPPHASDALRVKIQHELGWNCQVVQPESVYKIKGEWNKNKINFSSKDLASIPRKSLSCIYGMIVPWYVLRALSRRHG
jgi:metallo-beta-lactamase family protein